MRKLLLVRMANSDGFLTRILFRSEDIEISPLVIQTHSHTTLKSPCTETKCLNEKDVWQLPT